MDCRKHSQPHRRQRVCLLAASLLLCSGWVQAECRISTGAGMLDYGQINTQVTRGPDGKHQLTSRAAIFRVECDEPRKIRLAFSDSSGSQRQFAFGRDGVLEAGISALMLDDRATAYRDISSVAGQKSDVSRQAGALLPGSEIEIVDAGRHLNFVVTVHPVFTDQLFALQDDYRPGNDITVSIIE
ncbi:hypothetical protein LJN55_20640 [Erwinia rhapontici]|uniref:hypothetical protein n=1 Tax=Erwinia rhapontici TaxID=55212 RepID=UPI001D0DBAA5|nr:hypothetical protein [Erwinia rhapontici]UDQ79803.1 hypothetical protein LJN55_20640 [Erwinia rhapontici]